MLGKGGHGGHGGGHGGGHHGGGHGGGYGRGWRGYYEPWQQVVVVTEAAPYPELEPTYTATAIELGPKYRWMGGMLWNLDLTGNWLKLDRGSALYMLTAAQSRLMQSGKLGTRPVTR